MIWQLDLQKSPTGKIRCFKPNAIIYVRFMLLRKQLERSFADRSGFLCFAAKESPVNAVSGKLASIDSYSTI